METNGNTNKTTTFFVRLLAFTIDFSFIAIYIFSLLALSIQINKIWSFHHLMDSSYLLRHLISFFSLTLPVVMYFVLMEYKEQATIGKKLLNLQVRKKTGGSASFSSILIRNVIKFLPWELAHIVIHLNPDFITHGDEMSSWLTIGLLFPQAITLIYVAMIFIRKDKRSLYEILSNTKVSIQHS